MPDAEPMPDAAMVMLKTRLLNDWLGTSYSLDDVADMDELTFEVLMSIPTLVARLAIRILHVNPKPDTSMRATPRRVDPFLALKKSLFGCGCRLVSINHIIWVVNDCCLGVLWGLSQTLGHASSFCRASQKCSVSISCMMMTVQFLYLSKRSS